MSEIENQNQELYTKSAIIDKISDEFKHDKELDNIIYNLQFQKAVLTLNPTKYPTLLELCATSPEEVKLYVREAIVKMLIDYNIPKSGIEFVRDYFDLKLVFDESVPLENLTADLENTIIQTVAQVVSVGRRESYIKEIHYTCQDCSYKEIRNIENLQCPNCKKAMNIDLIIYGDTILAEIQQPYDEIIVQPTPYTAQFFDDDVFTLKIGDLKKLVLIRKSVFKKNKSTRKIILHVLSSTDTVQKSPKLPDEELCKKFQLLAGSDIYIDTLTRSIAPNVLYQDLAKLGCLLAVVGGTPVSGVRSKLHAMLCGDPSEAKTTIIKFFTRLPFQKTGYAVGSQASGQGVTVAMTTLGDGTKFPRAGIIVLCTEGYVGLDELNLMPAEEIDKIRECAEDGELSYNKAGFNLKLVANTTIISGLNPKWHVYDFERSMKDNLGLPLPLLSRFDIKVNITSPHDITRERKIITHIYNSKTEGVDEYIKERRLLTSEELSLLINYARTFSPVADEVVKNKLIEFYIEQKKLEYDEQVDTGKLRIDRRTGRSLILIAEAFARLHFSDKVTEKHADMAIQFARDCVRTFGYDPDLGLVQTTIQESITTPRKAFEFVCTEIEKHSNDGHFTEVEVTSMCLDKFPALFKHDYEVHDIWKIYDDAARFTSKGGRYKLV